MPGREHSNDSHFEKREVMPMARRQEALRCYAGAFGTTFRGTSARPTAATAHRAITTTRWGFGVWARQESEPLNALKDADDVDLQQPQRGSAIRRVRS